MNLFLIILITLLWGYLAAKLAKTKNRDPIRWFVIGILFGVFSLLALFFLPEKRKEEKIQNFFTKPGPWYYIDNSNETIGPISLQQMNTLFQSQEICPDTYVWQSGMKTWKRLRELTTS